MAALLDIYEGYIPHTPETALADAGAEASGLDLILSNGQIDETAYIDALAQMRAADAARATILEAVDCLGGDVESADGYLQDLFGDCLDRQRKALKALEAF